MKSGLSERFEMHSLKRWLIVSLGIAALALPILGQSPHVSIAQSATPTAVVCQKPVPAFEPAFPPLVVPDATPIAASSPVATAEAPLVVAGATPMAASTAVATPTVPVGLQTKDAITSTIDFVAACQSDHDVETLLTLVTERYLGQAYGGGQRLNHEDYRLLAAAGPTIPLQILSVENFRFDGMQTVSADVTFVAGNQLRHEEWTFLFHHKIATSSDGTAFVGTPAPTTGEWMLHGFHSLPVQNQASATRVPVTIKEYSISLPDNPIGGDEIVLEGKNVGSETHEMLVLRISPGASTDDLLDPNLTAFPAGIKVIGQTTVPPGTTQEMTLVDLEPGTYTIVSLFPNQDGTPQLVLGEKASFTFK